MSWFGKDKKEDKKGFNSDSKLPELPRLPELSDMNSGNGHMNSMSHLSEPASQLPSYPKNSIGERLSRAL